MWPSPPPPINAPDRAELLDEIGRLRALHVRMSSLRADATADIIHESRERIVATRHLIDAAEARIRIAGRRLPTP